MNGWQLTAKTQFSIILRNAICLGVVKLEFPDFLKFCIQVSATCGMASDVRMTAVLMSASSAMAITRVEIIQTALQVCYLFIHL